MSATRCQAKNPTACSDPRCPDKKSLDHVFARAIKAGDFDSYAAAREEQAKRFRPTMFMEAHVPSDWDTLYTRDTETDYTVIIKVDPTEFATYSKDTAVIQEYGTWKDIQSDYREDKNVMLFLDDNNGRYGDESLPGFHLNEFYISPKLRGQGAGTHIMRTMMAHADKNVLAIELVPTESGDGKLENGQDGWREAAITHRERLINFYERHGFVRNPFFEYSGVRDEEGNRIDYLTKQSRLPDTEARNRYTQKASRILAEHSMFIRFPNGKPPRSWLRKEFR